MSDALKKRVLEEYRKKKEEEKLKDSNVKEDIEEIVDSIIKGKDEKEKNDDEKESDSTNDKDSDENSDFENEILKKNIIVKTKEIEKGLVPYFYIDYNSSNIKQAKNFGYQTLKVDRDGLTKKLIHSICDGKHFDLRRTNIIINFWRVITKSNLNSYSQECTPVKMKKFKNKLETTYKWGSKITLKDKLSRDEQKDYSLIRDDIYKLFKFLHNSNIKIFIICNSHYSFVKAILEHYKLDKFIEEVFTPSRCSLPLGSMLTHDVFKDGKKLDRGNMFACIERYIGRIPKLYPYVLEEAI